MCVCDTPSLAALVNPATPEGVFRFMLWHVAHEVTARGANRARAEILEPARALHSLLVVPVKDRQPATLARLLADAEADLIIALAARLWAPDRRKRKRRRHAPQRWRP
jgi:precorrin-6B methylase 1